MFFVRPDFLRLLKSLKTDEDLDSVETLRSTSTWQSWDKRLTKPFKLITHLSEPRLFNLLSMIWSQSTVSHLFARTRSFHRPTFIRPNSNRLHDWPWNATALPMYCRTARLILFIGNRCTVLTKDIGMSLIHRFSQGNSHNRTERDTPSHAFGIS